MSSALMLTSLADADGAARNMPIQTRVNNKRQENNQADWKGNDRTIIVQLWWRRHTSRTGEPLADLFPDCGLLPRYISDVLMT